MKPNTSHIISRLLGESLVPEVTAKQVETALSGGGRPLSNVLSRIKDKLDEYGVITLLGGYRLDVATSYEVGATPPWHDYAGSHLGSVSDWTTRDKKPGEKIVAKDRSSFRYYDYQGAVANAKAEGASPTAVDAEFEHFRAWANDEWHYLNAWVALVDDDGDEVDYAVVGGYASNDRDFIIDSLADIANELLSKYAKQIELSAKDEDEVY